MRTLGDIRTRFEMAMNEASGNPAWRIKSEAAYYSMFPKEGGGRWIMPGKSHEIMRAWFGSSEPEADAQKFLEFNGLKSEYYSNTLTPSNKSGSFDSWSITITTKCEVFGKTFKVGEKWHIVNARKESNTGAVAIIGDKDTTPNKMHMTNILFKTIDHVKSFSKDKIKEVLFDEDYIEFMEELVDVVANFKPSGSDISKDTLTMATKSTTYKIPHNFSKWDGIIDAISVANIKKDFGEVLGGILMFKIIKEHGVGLLFPEDENEAVVDFVFNNLHVSSKADEGGNASASGYLKKINAAISDKTRWKGLSKEEEDFIKNVSAHILDEPKEPKNNTYYTKSKGSGTLSSTAILCNKHLPRTSAWFYWASATGMDIHSLNRDAIVQSFVRLKEQGDAHSTLSTYLKKAGGFTVKRGSSEGAIMTKRLVTSKNEEEIAEVIDDILKSDKASLYNVLVGIIIYTSSNDLVDVLNDKYASTMSGLINKALSAKQLYLKFNITRGYMEFQMKSMEVSDFKIAGLNGADTWMSKGLSIKMIK